MSSLDDLIADAMSHLPEQIDTNLALWWGAGIACAWAALWSLILYGLGRRDGAAAKVAEAAEIARLTDWATETARELPVIDPARPGRYRGHRRAVAPTWRARAAGWRAAYGPRLAGAALAVAGASLLRERCGDLRPTNPIRTTRSSAVPQPVPARPFLGIPAAVA